MVPNLANITKNNCFPKNSPIFLQYFLSNFVIFGNTNGQYCQNNPFLIIYQMNTETLERKYSST